MRLALGLVAASGADIVTAALLPPSGEANPVVLALLAAGPLVPALLKVALTGVLVAWLALPLRYGRSVAAIAIAAWAFGALTNLATIGAAG